MVGERGKLLDGGEHVNELGNTLAKEVKLAEDVALVEVKLLHLGLRGQFVFGDPVLLLVGVVKAQHCIQVLDERVWILLPKIAVLRHVLLALGDHLVGDFAEEDGHALGIAVVSRDCQHHFDIVHQAWQRFDNLLRVAVVEWLCVLFEGGKVLDVVLGLVERIGDAVVNVLPALEDLGALGHLTNHDGILGLELLHHRIELGHAPAPVLEFAVRP